jgi:alkyl hydroperoxide reductase subunit AhpC
MAESMAMVGKRAPAFSLEYAQGLAAERRRVTLDDYQDQWLILLFYPRDFSML